MKVTVYCAKGAVGKTPIAYNLALTNEWAMATNEIYNVLENEVEDSMFLSVKPHERFPDFPVDIDMVFDLGGYIESSTPSIISALEQSNCVIVPVYDEYKALRAAIATIQEVAAINANIVVVATKLRTRGESGLYEQGDEFLNIKKILFGALGQEFPMFPLKMSGAFDSIFDENQSVSALAKNEDENGERIILPMIAHHYRPVADQFEIINRFIKASYDK